MKSKAVQFLEANQSGERSTFVDDAKWRQENASWLRRSRRILSGKVNFSFKTISEIEEGLGIEVFQAAAMEA